MIANQTNTLNTKKQLANQSFHCPKLMWIHSRRHKVTISHWVNKANGQIRTVQNLLTRRKLLTEWAYQNDGKLPVNWVSKNNHWGWTKNLFDFDKPWIQTKIVTQIIVASANGIIKLFLFNYNQIYSFFFSK